jgi:hypothetical protein
VEQQPLTISPSLVSIAPDSRVLTSPAYPGSGKIIRLFHPRSDTWAEHFVWDGPELKALTAIGRVTISLLMINEPEMISVRKALQEEGVFRA